MSRERVLSEAEIKTFLLGIDNCAISDGIRAALKLILITGQRPGEVITMNSAEINGRWWEFTPKETILTKQVPRRQRIYLTDSAMQLIGTKKGYIFPSPSPPKDQNDNPVPTPITERAVAYALRRNLFSHTVTSKPSLSKTRTKQKNKKPFIVGSPQKTE